MPRLRLLSGAIVAALVISTSAQATDFSKVVVFGDSLSDSGNISLATAPGVQPPLRFTTNPGETAIEHVADHFGVTLQPSLLPGGTNYAWGGAGVLNNSPGTPATVPTLTAQIDGYLAGGAIDPDALYSVWGGANDIFYHATAAGAAGAAQQLIAANVAAAVAQAQAGGLPDSQVPGFIAQITPVVTAQVNAAVAAQTGVSADAFESADQAQAAIGAAGQQEAKLIGALQAAGAKNILVFNLPNVGITPSAAAQEAASPGAAASLTGLALTYNGQLNAGLAQMGVGIIPVDTYSLLNEVAADPAAFGFSNVTDPACGAGASSVQCGPEGSGLPFTYAPGTDQSFLFADGVHPTAAGHAVLGQYVVAELQAPGQASLLAEAPLAVNAAHMRTLRNQMLADNMGSGTRLFASVDYGRQTFEATAGSPETDSRNVSLTLGVDARAGDNVSMGMALGLGRNDADVAGNTGGYQLNTVMASGYAVYHRGGGYIGGTVGFGQLDYNDVSRSFQLGALRRTEVGNTSGSQLAAGLNGGWWFGSDGLRTGPFAAVEWQRIRVTGYAEHGNDSSSMWFGSQQRRSMVGTLGWRLTGTWQAGGSALHPFAELAWNRDNNADPRAVQAGLNGMNGRFALDGYVPDEDWASVDLGVVTDFTANVSGWLGYNGRFGDDNQKLNSLNLGLKVAF